MFDFAWSEIALIGIVALIAIGPKDLPVAMKTISDFVKKARRMAGEFQTHVDEMVREANLHEVRDQFNEIRNFDFKGAIAKTIDEDGSLRRTMTEDPFTSTSPSAATHNTIGADTTAIAAPQGDVLTEDRPAEPTEPVAAESGTTQPEANAAPAFIPPEAARPQPAPPAFVPPEIVAAAEASRRASFF
jgi:sec-independent protein translocase protein TatB